MSEEISRDAESRWGASTLFPVSAIVMAYRISGDGPHCPLETTAPYFFVVIPPYHANADSSASEASSGELDRSASGTVN